MKLSRRQLFKLSSSAALTAMLPDSIAASAAPAPATTMTLDRKTIVQRHNPVVTAPDPFTALSVGNGEFAFTADVTGLQTLPEIYEKTFPLCTTAHWAWHRTPAPPEVQPESLGFKKFDTYGRPVPYATDAKGQEVLF